ncbi:hypothetical protein FDP41_004431 [Naegleria fowleri]|uniref:Nudix hydrolase domain-containing protein n=1 Tax=Naegleria fowleri TaxID=5763 RepID=A0A6A5BNY6_NAEFO|nr:uncharacterized protein FDP41_004431 [Naegleria fowleri]KAF0976532.1 hypothetical protein FDP41_004431 [Naegleria fowleri]
MFIKSTACEKFCLFSEKMINSSLKSVSMDAPTVVLSRNCLTLNHHHQIIRNPELVQKKSSFSSQCQLKLFSSTGLHHRCYHASSLHRMQSSQDQTQEIFPNLTNFLKMGSSDFFEVLKSIDFHKNEKQRPTFHEYNNYVHNNNGGVKLKLSRRPDPTARSSAVMVLFFKRGEKGEPYLVLLQKTSAKKNTNYQHAGQISFPGGVFDPQVDQSLLETAIRETNEEIGKQNIQVLNESLPTTMTGARNFNVKPFIGRLINSSSTTIGDDEEENGENFHYILQTEEIAHLFEVKVLDLIQNSRFEPLGKTIINSSFTHYGPVFHLNNLRSVTRNEMVPYANMWGFTATIVAEILDAMEEAVAPLSNE